MSVVDARPARAMISLRTVSGRRRQWLDHLTKGIGNCPLNGTSDGEDSYFYRPQNRRGVWGETLVGESSFPVSKSISECPCARAHSGLRSRACTPDYFGLFLLCLIQRPIRHFQSRSQRSAAQPRQPHLTASARVPSAAQKPPPAHQPCRISCQTGDGELRNSLQCQPFPLVGSNPRGGSSSKRPAGLAGLFFCPLPAESRLLIRTI